MFLIELMPKHGTEKNTEKGRHFLEARELNDLSISRHWNGISLSANVKQVITCEFTD